jgi:hypothetical protein
MKRGILLAVAALLVLGQLAAAGSAFASPPQKNGDSNDNGK